MKVYVTRPIPETGIKMMTAAGHEVTVSTKNGVLTRKELLTALREHNPDAVLCLLTDKIDDEVFDAAPNARIFANYAVVFDMATSAMTFYGLVLAKARGEKIPDNMAIDNNGKPTNDPAEAMNGAILPFDRGYKGAGLGMIVEMLAGPLTNSAWIDNKTFAEEWGSLFIAIDPNLLVDTVVFKKNASDFIAKIKSSRKKEGVDEIRLPGERAARSRKEAESTGLVEVEDAIMKELGYI